MSLSSTWCPEMFCSVQTTFKRRHSHACVRVCVWVGVWECVFIPVCPLKVVTKLQLSCSSFRMVTWPDWSPTKACLVSTSNLNKMTVKEEQAAEKLLVRVLDLNLLPLQFRPSCTLTQLCVWVWTTVWNVRFESKLSVVAARRSKQRVSRWFSALSPDPTQSPLLTWFSHYRP